MDPNTQTLITMALGFLPHTYAIYAADVIGIAGLLSLISGQIAARVRPPSALKPKWMQVVYNVLTWPAQNFGWARNAVVPGMHPEVQQAAIAVAQVVAKMPELAPMPGALPAVLDKAA